MLATWGGNIDLSASQSEDANTTFSTCQHSDKCHSLFVTGIGIVGRGGPFLRPLSSFGQNRILLFAKRRADNGCDL
jgi:hypothetical protein